MAEKDSLNISLQSLTCPTCQGNDKHCPTCQGAGWLAWTRLQLLYWGRRIDARQLAQNQTKLAIKNIINLWLLVTGVLGFIALAWIFYLINQTDLPLWQFYRLKNFPLLVFWLSLVGDSYLFYRLQTELEKFK